MTTERWVKSGKIVTAFLEPALAEIEWRKKWRAVNRAAVVIVGWSLAVGAERPDVIAERIIVAVEALFGNAPARVQLTDGLRERVAEILVLMS